jgi:hypothetical protein
MASIRAVEDNLRLDEGHAGQWCQARMEAVARRGNAEIVKRDVLPCASPVVPAGPLPRTLPGKRRQRRIAPLMNHRVCANVG